MGRGQRDPRLRTAFPDLVGEGAEARELLRVQVDRGGQSDRNPKALSRAWNRGHGAGPMAALVPITGGTTGAQQTLRSSQRDLRPGMGGDKELPGATILTPLGRIGMPPPFCRSLLPPPHPGRYPLSPEPCARLPIPPASRRLPAPGDGPRGGVRSCTSQLRGRLP